MKKKLLFGLATIGIACLFVACGSGDILDFQPTDQFVQYDYASGGETDAALDGMVNQAVSDYCTANNYGSDCNKALQPDYVESQP